MGRITEFRVRRVDDPDGARAAAILSAYFQVERARQTRRLLWRTLAALALPWFLFGLETPLLPRRVFAAGGSVLAAVAAIGTLPEQRAGRKLTALLDGR